MAQENQAERIVAEAARLIEEIERQLDDRESSFRALGIDTQRLAALQTPRMREEAARLVADDLAAVEREVEEARARLSFSQPSPKPATRPRMLI